MANFNYSINAESAVKEYDNQGAYNTLQEMMKRKEQLTVKFYGGKDSTRCVWIESAHVAGFKYQLKSASYKGLLDYLFKGDVTDFDTNPKVADTLNENEDFQLGILKAMIDAGKTIQYVPLFREHPDYISAILPCFKGKIMFRIKRTEETLSYLRENKQTV
jgi:hypothetical protein